MKINDRVKIDLLDVNGQELYGTILDPNWIGVLVECDTEVDERYYWLTLSEAVFPRELVKVI